MSSFRSEMSFHGILDFQLNYALSYSAEFHHSLILSMEVSNFPLSWLNA